MATSVKKNFAYNFILTVGNYIFPLLTYPYVSRVLGVENIGLCNYVDSIINYFVLFSALGVGSLGVREIAKCKDNKDSMSEVFTTLSFFNIALTGIMSILLVILTLTVSFFEPYKPFLLLGLCKLIFSAFLVEWFYTGTSNFKYITTRALIVRTLYVISVFLFVKDSGDSIIYYILLCSTVVINSVINWCFSRKFVRFDLSKVKLSVYFFPIISYGIYRILTSMYTSFNVAYLGSVTDVIQVGYFTTATKLYTIILSVFTAFTMVMVPKVSEMLAKKEHERLKEISIKTFDIIFACSIPLIICCFFYAPIIIRIIAGEGYEGAIMPFKIVMLLLIIVAIEQIVIQQFLMAYRDSKCILVLSGVGALVGIVLNIILVPKFMAVGSAISWMTSELAVLIVGLFYFEKFYKLSLPTKHLIFTCFKGIPYVVICIVFRYDSICWQILIPLALLLLYFLLSNFKLIHKTLIK